MIIYDEPEVLDSVAKLPDEVDVTIKGLKHKRSKNANDCLWGIIDGISLKTGVPKEEVYLQLLKRYGQSVIVTIKEGIDPSCLFKYFERFNDGLHNGVKFVAWKVFIGSSQYDTAQMAKLIDGAQQEAKELGVQTETYDNIGCGPTSRTHQRGRGNETEEML